MSPTVARYPRRPDGSIKRTQEDIELSAEQIRAELLRAYRQRLPMYQFDSYSEMDQGLIFPSNQFNTLFFFLLLTVAVMRPGKNLWRLPLTAAYAVFTLSKVVIFGSAASLLLVALLYQVFWLYFGIATVAIYGLLVEQPSPSLKMPGAWPKTIWERLRS